MIIKFDGSIGIMSATREHPLETYLLIKKGIGAGNPGDVIKHNYYKKNSVVKFDKFDVVFSFTNPISIDVLIKSLKIAKKDLMKRPKWEAQWLPA